MKEAESSFGSALSRDSFNEVAELYAKARPPYPKELVADLISMTGLKVTHRVLEIGPGTGQLTKPLAEYGVSLTAVELGERLGSVLRRQLARFERTKVEVADFDSWIPPTEPFDLVVAATAFHWLDPATRVENCVKKLARTGKLAIIQTHWGAGDRDKAFLTESQSCYARWDPRYDPDFQPRTLDDLPERHEELEGSRYFGPIAHRRYISEREYSANEYADLLRTFSDVRKLPEGNRQAFLACISALINDRFRGRIVRENVYDLWVAQPVVLI